MVTAFFTQGLADAGAWPLTPEATELLESLLPGGTPEWRLSLRRGQEPVVDIDDQSVFEVVSVGGPHMLLARVGLLDWGPLGLREGGYRARLVASRAGGMDAVSLGESHGFDDVVYLREA